MLGSTGVLALFYRYHEDAVLANMNFLRGGVGKPTTHDQRIKNDNI